ncbi:hypothetical protein QL285_030540 [Trifolium repens]|nr:hypothetical protein QL285_030540 [Trifolium repens]
MRILWIVEKGVSGIGNFIQIPPSLSIPSPSQNVALDPSAVSKSTIQLFDISADELTEAYSTVRFPEKSDLGQRLSTYSMQSPYELDMANSEENARSCMEPRYNSKIC